MEASSRERFAQTEAKVIAEVDRLRERADRLEDQLARWSAIAMFEDALETFAGAVEPAILVELLPDTVSALAS